MKEQQFVGIDIGVRDLAMMSKPPCPVREGARSGISLSDFVRLHLCDYQCHAVQFIDLNALATK
jgi:hypothetical protein